MKVLTVVGGQFGSEAKGHVAAQLARREVDHGRQVYAVRVAGPNAGHTAYDSRGRGFALRTIPAMAVVDPGVKLILAAGSEIDIPVLMDEITMLEDAGHPVIGRLYIDAQATILEAHHHQAESDQTLHKRLGSTGKGIGAARADRLLRRAEIWGEKQIIVHNDATWVLPGHDTATMFVRWHEESTPDGTVIVEGTQGYGLGLHAGHYPFCTSSDCRAIDFLAMAGIDPRMHWVDECTTWVVMRRYPIRVAGNSGPLVNELTWEELAERSGGYIKPERTTVTKKIRRIGEWDHRLAHDAIMANGGPDSCRVALTFADYIDPAVAGATRRDQLTDAVTQFLRTEMLGWDVRMVTTGPDTAVWM